MRHCSIHKREYFADCAECKADQDFDLASTPHPSAYYQQSDLHQQVYETLLWRGDIIPTTEAGVALAEQGERERMAKVREIRERPQYSRDGNCACRVCDWCIARSDIKALLQLLHVQEGRV
jgi:hypothetical protein